MSRVENWQNSLMLYHVTRKSSCILAWTNEIRTLSQLGLYIFCFVRLERLHTREGGINFFTQSFARSFDRSFSLSLSRLVSLRRFFPLDEVTRIWLRAQLHKWCPERRLVPWEQPAGGPLHHRPPPLHPLLFFPSHSYVTLLANDTSHTEPLFRACLFRSLFFFNRLSQRARWHFLLKGVRWTLSWPRSIPAVLHS